MFTFLHIYVVVIFFSLIRDHGQYKVFFFFFFQAIMSPELPPHCRDASLARFAVNGQPSEPCGAPAPCTQPRRVHNSSRIQIAVQTFLLGV